jgi:two-component system sensor histidine kinase PhoQ
LSSLSLQHRILIAAAVLLVVFVALTGLTLESAFRDSASSAREARLLGQLYLLMAAADIEDGRLRLPSVLDEPRFGLPGSGLYGQIADVNGAPVWRSRSAVGLDVPFLSALAPGQVQFQMRRDSVGNAFLVQGFGVLWSTGPVSRAYTFSVAEDQSELGRELTRFRTTLVWGLGLMSALLLIALLTLLRWGLRPLRRVATEIAAIEAGERRRLEDRYPRDLAPLTDNVNALLAHGEAREARLSNALGDLAHSLKTPLAVLRGAIAEIEHLPTPSQPPSQAPIQAPIPPPVLTMQEQIARMDQIVAYQLERARSATPSSGALAARVDLSALVQRLTATLSKIYADKAVSLTLDLDGAAPLRGVEGDLMELLGNLLDNAYKWCRSRVGVRVWQAQAQLFISVDDDGPGIEPALANRLLERGMRADESTPGHGIGLAVVREISLAYGGDVLIERSEFGGARIQVRFPL